MLFYKVTTLDKTHFFIECVNYLPSIVTLDKNTLVQCSISDFFKISSAHLLLCMSIPFLDL